jgi:hypothetical protein
MFPYIICPLGFRISAGIVNCERQSEFQTSEAHRLNSVLRHLMGENHFIYIADEAGQQYNVYRETAPPPTVQLGQVPRKQCTWPDGCDGLQLRQRC